MFEQPGCGSNVWKKVGPCLLTAYLPCAILMKCFSNQGVDLMSGEKWAVSANSIPTLRNFYEKFQLTGCVSNVRKKSWALPAISIPTLCNFDEILKQAEFGSNVWGGKHWVVSANSLPFLYNFGK